jgi:hypothetical protein
MNKKKFFKANSRNVADLQEVISTGP